jgi:hypothetical protein
LTVYTKLLVTKGDSSNPSAVDIVDFSNASTTCAYLPNIPGSIYSYDTVGGLGFQNEPIVCVNEINVTKCYSYVSGVWGQYSYNVSVSRHWGSSVANANPSGTWKIATAGGDQTPTAGTTIEYLTSTGWKMSTAKLPRRQWHNCMTAINSSTFFLFEGHNFDTNYQSQRTFFLNIDSNTVVEGPPIKIARERAGCSILNDRVTGGKYIVIAGGYNSTYYNYASPYWYLNTSEILDLATLTWKMGPNIPIQLDSPQMIEHPQGGVVLIGGTTPTGPNSVGVTTGLYHLPTSSSTAWNTLPQKLKIPRSDTSAFFVPDSIVSCK